MSSEAAIRIAGLGKAYQIRHQQPHTTLAEHALERIRHPFRRSSSETLWALKDVTLEIARGEVLGLIGRNGAGKSTLLKVLSRITPPTNGRIEVSGRVGTLLEVGTGFHPELTGRENVYLNGAILGMKTSEIDRQFDAIIDFAGVAQFLDTPVKRYSSGMYVRLAFAVAAHLQTEVLLIDEVLAVGDQEFQRKCIGTMSDAATSGRTVVLVTHNMGVVEQLADRAAILQRGTLEFLGNAADAVAHYLASTNSSDGTHVFTDRDRWDPLGLSRHVELIEGRWVDRAGGHFAAGEDVRFELDLRCNRATDTFRISYTVFTASGQPVGSAFSEPCGAMTRGGHRVEMVLPSLNLAPGSYYFGLATGVGDGLDQPIRDFDVVLNVLPFEIGPIVSEQGGTVPWPQSWGTVRLPRAIVKPI